MTLLKTVSPRGQEHEIGCLYRIQYCVNVCPVQEAISTDLVKTDSTILSRAGQFLLLNLSH